MSQPRASGDVERLDDPAQKRIHELSINAIRFLSIDMVERANSGHPGAPMGAAAFAYVLWTRHLRHNPADPSWFDRDRFILSAGHASALLYSLLHLTGYDLPLDELKRFRQWGSLTPGHPENELTPGVEVTTGPLGQGFANGVGMALAEALLAARFNDANHRIVDHHVFALVSDGDLQEGIASEAASLAGTLKLGKLVYLYDDNDVQIEGPTDLVFTEDVGARFRAYGWQVVGPIDGYDLDAIDEAIGEARRETERPSLVICRTRIAYGSPGKEGSSSAHGSPLGPQEVLATREALDWPHPPFVVPEEVLAHMRMARDRGSRLEAEWNRRLALFAQADPARADEFERVRSGELPAGWDGELAGLFAEAAGAGAAPTRSASGAVINHLAVRLPELIGGSADLASSNNTEINGEADFQALNRRGRNLRFGVREHAMAGIANGMARHGGVIPYVGTFLVFTDYMRPSIRLAAMQKLRVIYVLTHDSIGLGEDGPTHQPIEHLASLRAIPNLTVIRPADAAETAEAWRAALGNAEGPTAIVLSRQKVEPIDRSRNAPASGLHQGAYILRDPERHDTGIPPELILIASGSEVPMALQAADALAEHGVRARVVSMPSWELFAKEPRSYRDQVLVPSVGARLAIEAASSFGWDHWLGSGGAMIAMERYGASAPPDENFRRFGFTADKVVERALALLGRGGGA